MNLSETQQQTVRAVYEAMQAGASGEDRMLNLFTADGILIEPFSGSPREHVGQDAIRKCYREMMAQPRPPDFQLKLERIDAEGSQITADWTCSASVLPLPIRGRDRYRLENGKIKQLEITLVGDVS